MALNLSNFGMVQGNLAKDPKVFENADGSKKVFLTVACRDNFTRKDGTVGTEFVDLQAFISKDAAHMGPFAYLKKGSHVTLAYTVVHDEYVRNGQTLHKQYLRVYNNEVILPSKGKNTTDEYTSDASDDALVDDCLDIPF